MQDSNKHNKQMQLKEKEMQMKKDIEDKKLEAIKIQNQNQIELANKKAQLDKEMANKKLELEKLKIKASNNNKTKK
jgi:hypothetical protein